MSSKTVTLTMLNDYPFSISSDYDQPRTTVQVKKTVPSTMEPRYIMKEKIRCLKSLGSALIVTLLQTSEEQNNVNLMFEYVHKKLDTEQWSMDAQCIDRVQKQLCELGQVLAGMHIIHEFKFHNVGLDKSLRLKYFLGFDFKIDKTSNKDDLNLKYQQVVNGMFGQGGRFRRTASPNQQSKPQYHETMDSIHHARLASSIQSKQKPSLTHPQLMMKKSSTAVQNNRNNTYNQLEEWWEGNTNQDSKKMLMSIGCDDEFRRESTHQIKAIKMQDLGARINKLREYMKDITGKTPKNCGGLKQISVKVDGNDIGNRIFQENKLLITPNYTKLQKKIAEFRASKFYRGYGQRQILYNKDKKGYQLTTKETIQPNGTNSIQDIKAIDCKKEKNISPKNTDRKVPQYLLDKEKKKEKPKIGVQLSNERNNSKEWLNSSKGKNNESSYQNQYKKLGKTDKYCQEFMYFLDDDINVQNQGEMSPLTHLITQIGKESDANKDYFRKQEDGDRSESNKSTAEIQGRVKTAIRNSLKLINGLKYRQSQTVK